MMYTRSHDNECCPLSCEIEPSLKWPNTNRSTSGGAWLIGAWYLSSVNLEKLTSVLRWALSRVD